MAIPTFNGLPISALPSNPHLLSPKNDEEEERRKWKKRKKDIDIFQEIPFVSWRERREGALKAFFYVFAFFTPFLFLSPAKKWGKLIFDSELGGEGCSLFICVGKSGVLGGIFGAFFCYSPSAFGWAALLLDLLLLRAAKMWRKGGLGWCGVWTLKLYFHSPHLSAAAKNNIGESTPLRHRPPTGPQGRIFYAKSFKNYFKMPSC